MNAVTGSNIFIAKTIPSIPVAGQELIVSTAYKGIHFNQKAVISSVDKGQIAIQILGEKSLINTGESVYLHIPGSHRVFRTEVISINNKTAEMTVGKLHPVLSRWRERRSLRVQPASPTVVQVKLGSVTASGFLADISTEGLGFLLYQLEQIPLVFKPPQHVRITLPLEDASLVMDLPALILSLHRLSRDMTRIGASLLVPTLEKAYLAAYISSRRQSIHEEMNNLFIRSMDPRWTSQLFF